MDLERVQRSIGRKQLKSIVESTRAKIALWTGAVSAGKTIASLLAFLIAVQAAPRHGLIIMCGKTLQTIERNLIVPLQSPELFGPMAAEVHHTAGANTAVILGRTVHLIGANDIRSEDKIRGVTVCLAYVDEATLVPRGFWMMLLSRLRVPGARLLATTNPDGPAHWLRKDFILRASQVNLAHWHFTLEDNPSLTDEYKRDIVAQYIGLWHRRFILGEWCLAQGAVFDMVDLTPGGRHVVDVLPQIARWVALGVDYGTVNPTAALLLGVGEDRNLYLTHEWRHDPAQAHRSLVDADLSRELRGWLSAARVPGASGLAGISPEWVVVDPAAASFRLQLHRDGMLPRLADNAVLDGLRMMASLLGQDLLKVHSSCAGLLAELPGYSWDDDAAKKGEDKPIKADDHSIDAARYAIKSTEVLWRPMLRSAYDLAA